MPITSVRLGADEATDPSAAASAALQAVGRGDEDAFERLYRLTVTAVTATAQSVVLDRGQIEDVVQEAYLEIWRWAGRYDPTVGPALPWMLCIVRHRSIDRIRQREAARARERAFLREQTFVAPDESTLERVLRTERSRELQDAMGRLTERQREALWLTYFGHCSGTQLSTRLGLPLGTVKARVRDGVSGLRNMVVGSE